MSTIFDRYYQDAKKEFMSHVSQEIIDITKQGGQCVSHKQYQELRMNSFERKYLIPFLEREALINTIEYCLSQCCEDNKGSFACPVTYNEALINDLVPELIKRLKQ